MMSYSLPSVSAISEKLTLQHLPVSFLFKEEQKKELVNKIIAKILRIMEENRIEKVSFDSHIIYQFTPKYHEKRIFCSLSINQEETLAEVHIDKQVSTVDRIGLTNILLLVDYEGIIIADKQIKRFLNGNHFEKIFRFKKEIYKIEEWNDWKAKDQRAARAYENLIYPVCLEYVRKITKLKKNIRVLEICAGDGEFAKSVLKENCGINFYTLIDSNLQACGKATENLTEFIEKKLSKVILDDIRKYKFENDSAIKDSDMIIGIGALTTSVTETHEVALEILTMLSKCLKIGGYVLLAGYTPSLLCSDDFKNKGFEVINMYGPRISSSVYLVRKNRDCDYKQCIENILIDYKN